MCHDICCCDITVHWKQLKILKASSLVNKTLYERAWFLPDPAFLKNTNSCFSCAFPVEFELLLWMQVWSLIVYKPSLSSASPTSMLACTTFTIFTVFRTTACWLAICQSLTQRAADGAKFHGNPFRSCRKKWQPYRGAEGKVGRSSKSFNPLGSVNIWKGLLAIHPKQNDQTTIIVNRKTSQLIDKLNKG